jgi:methylated-DNA-[protein]-cysteine S-methyltransferase
MPPPPSLTIATVETLSGRVHLAVTREGVLAAAGGAPRAAFEASLRRRLGSIPGASRAAHTRLETLVPSIVALAAGEAVDVRTIPVDLRDRPPFDRAVLEAVRDVPWGVTASYGEIARRIGVPRAARAVGGAVGRNPLWMLVPCHRIISADGTLGGFGGVGPFERADGLELKRRLLLREGVTVRTSTE